MIIICKDGKEVEGVDSNRTILEYKKIKYKHTLFYVVICITGFNITILEYKVM